MWVCLVRIRSPVLCLCHCVQSLKKAEDMLLEKASALKHAELQLSKTNIELETKSAHVESLLQESGEVCATMCYSVVPVVQAAAKLKLDGVL